MENNSFRWGVFLIVVCTIIVLINYMCYKKACGLTKQKPYYNVVKKNMKIEKIEFRDKDDMIIYFVDGSIFKTFSSEEFFDKNKTYNVFEYTSFWGTKEHIVLPQGEFPPFCNGLKEGD